MATWNLPFVKPYFQTIVVVSTDLLGIYIDGKVKCNDTVGLANECHHGLYILHDTVVNSFGEPSTMGQFPMFV